MVVPGIASNPEPSCPAECTVEPEAIADFISWYELSQTAPVKFRPLLEMIEAHPWAAFPVLILVGYGLGKLIEWVITRLLTKLTGKTKTHIDDIVLVKFLRPVLPTMVILFLLLGVIAMPLPVALHNALSRSLLTILMVIWLVAWLRAVGTLFAYMARHRNRYKIVTDRTQPVFEMTGKIVLVIIAFVLFLVIWGIDPKAWLASAGVIGIVVGFAARDSIGNLISGMSIVADAPYKLGDFIVLDTGDRGMVTNVGLRSTRILTRDDLEVTIPNSLIANAKLINETGGPSPKSRIRVPVGVAYGSDLDHVERVLVDVAREHERMLDDPEPRARMRGFGDSSINFELLGWIAQPRDRGLVLHEVMMAVYRRFSEEGIHIPFPQRDVWVKEHPSADSES